MLARAKQTYAEFHPKFWTLVGASFIDRLGGALIFPFLSLYMVAKFKIGMVTVGELFLINSVTSLVGSFIGGALTDKFGRKVMIIFGLVISAVTTLAIGFTNELTMFFFVIAFAGLFASIGWPAQEAMVADLLPGDQLRSQGYGILRVATNLSVTIGPAIGGILAAQSYLWLFVIDAIMSTITAVIFFFVIPETKPEAKHDEPSQSIWQTVSGYRLVLKDGLYMVYLLFCTLSALVYVQMNSSLSVFLNTQHGVPAQGFGYILSLNALMVVLFQFWITRRTAKFPPLAMVIAGMLFYAVGFTLYGFVGTYGLFLFAMAIITVGEMLYVPYVNAITAHFSPPEMRGRYMAIAGFSWNIPFAIGPLLAGVIMDYYDPNWVWYAGGLVCLVSAFGYIVLWRPMAARLGAGPIDIEEAMAGAGEEVQVQ